ncbi:MAG: transglutaminase domain-containing protein [Lysinibacillus sp.]
MAIYFENLQQFKESGGLKASTITANQLLPAVVAHMQRMDRKFTLQVNGRLPKSMDALLEDVFALCHLQQPFYTQHCASRHTRYMNVSKNRVKIEFTLKYRMTREEEKWVLAEINRILQAIVTKNMSTLQKIIAVHDYIVRAYDYEMQTDGSPFTVYTFMHERQGVCMAYALLFEKMMELLSIPCLYVVGKADGEGDAGHAWNMVQLDGYWYHIDATWNDLGKRLKGHEIRYRYFLRSDEFMKKDHQWNFDHYPICQSERFKQLSNVYDAAVIGEQLYFPHPKTAYLTTLQAETLVFKVVLKTRVQYCASFNDLLYVSNFDDNGYLYRFEPNSHQFEVVEKRQVTRIEANEQQLTVTFVGGEQYSVQQQVVEQGNEQQVIDATIEVPLLSFGESWFGTYEGEASTVAFKSSDGVVVTIVEQVQQLTVDILLNKGLDIRITSSRKEAQFERAAVITLPKTLVGVVENIRQASGQAIEYTLNDIDVNLFINRSTKIIF